VIKLALFLGVVVLALWIYCLVDVLGSRDDQVRALPRLGWFVVVLLFPLVGSTLWLVLGRPEGARPALGGQRAMPAFPEHDRPGRATASSPEADEAFLRRVRERAEEQRRRYRAQQEDQQEDQQGDPQDPAEVEATDPGSPPEVDSEQEPDSDQGAEG
jgi:Phospholipase_D-nuclease N-terminal